MNIFLKSAAPVIALTLFMVTGACQRSDDLNNELLSETFAEELERSGDQNVPTEAELMDDAIIFAVLDEINEKEIGLAQAALQNATSSDVRAFAQKMVESHTSFYNEASTVANRLRIDPN